MTTVTPSSLRALAPELRARLIYQEARGAASEQLWTASTSSESTASGSGSRAAFAPAADVDPAGFLALWETVSNRAAPIAAPTPPAPRDPLQDGGDDPDGQASHDKAGAGEHGGHAYREMIGPAAERTGLPAAALAAIIDAEAAKGADGRWLALSRNPRSSAAGLGQFLSGTWKDEAQRPGTWLNRLASANGWLNEHGRIKGDAKSALLAMRYDPRAAIEAVADYASANLGRLRQAGVSFGGSTQDIARAAYFAHHLGIADAIDFLAGRIRPERARKLLVAQIGAAAAEQRIQEAGSATAAHRGWLMHYVASRVRPDRYTASRAA